MLSWLNKGLDRRGKVSMSWLLLGLTKKQSRGGRVVLKIGITGLAARAVDEVIHKSHTFLFYGVVCGYIAAIPLLLSAWLTGDASWAVADVWLNRVGLTYQLPASIAILVFWYCLLRVDVSPYARNDLFSSFNIWCVGFILGTFVVTWLVSWSVGTYDPLATGFSSAFFWTGVPFGLYFVGEAIFQTTRQPVPNY